MPSPITLASINRTLGYDDKSKRVTLRRHNSPAAGFPVLVGDELFANMSEAAFFLGAYSADIGKALRVGPFTRDGLTVRYPTWVEAVERRDRIVLSGRVRRTASLPAPTVIAMPTPTPSPTTPRKYANMRPDAVRSATAAVLKTGGAMTYAQIAKRIGYDGTLDGLRMALQPLPGLEVVRRINHNTPMLGIKVAPAAPVPAPVAKTIDGPKFLRATKTPGGAIVLEGSRPWLFADVSAIPYALLAVTEGL